MGGGCQMNQSRDVRWWISIPKGFLESGTLPGSFQDAQVALFQKFETLVKLVKYIYQSSKVLGPSNAFPNLQGLGAQKKVYTVNLDPAVRNLAYPVTLRQL